MVNKMARNTDYFYKGYDVTNKNRLEKLKYEYLNPFGYNLESNLRRVKNYELENLATTQDLVKLKEIGKLK